MIYVTHDQIEAMTLADRIVLLRDGLIEQVGTPLDLFERPATRFVAGFLGSPQMNFIPGELFNSGGGLAVRLDDGSILALPRQGAPASPTGQKVILGLRPQHLGRASAAAPRAGHARVPAAIDLVQPTGSRAYITFPLGGVPVTAEVEPHEVRAAGRGHRNRPRYEQGCPDRSRNRPGHLVERSGRHSKGVVHGNEGAIARHQAVRHDNSRRQGTRLARRAALRGAGQRRAALHQARRYRGAARHRLPGARRELGHLHARDQQSEGEAGQDRLPRQLSTRAAPTPSGP